MSPKPELSASELTAFADIIWTLKAGGDSLTLRRSVLAQTTALLQAGSGASYIWDAGRSHNPLDRGHNHHSLHCLFTTEPGLRAWSTAILSLSRLAELV